jgi:UPF0716 protein FxsA
VSRKEVRTTRRQFRRPALVPLAVLVLLIVEVATIIAVGRWLGALPTVGLLLLGSLAGGLLLRREGTRAWRAFTAAVTANRSPHREVLDGVLVLTGGLLVLFPGFVSDALGVLCLLPPTRRTLRGLLGRYVARRTGAVRLVRVRSRRGPAAAADAPGGIVTRSGPGPGAVIEGEVAEPPARTPDPRPE